MHQEFIAISISSKNREKKAQHGKTENVAGSV
jgi:hypothetical protein